MTLYRRHFLTAFEESVLPSTRFVRAGAIWIPLERFPHPKFHLGQEVLSPFDEGEFNPERRDRAIIIGMEYHPDDEEPGWWYLPKWLARDAQPWFVEEQDWNYCTEDQFRALR